MLKPNTAVFHAKITLQLPPPVNPNAPSPVPTVAQVEQAIIDGYAEDLPNFPQPAVEVTQEQ